MSVQMALKQNQFNQKKNPLIVVREITDFCKTIIITVKCQFVFIIQYYLVMKIIWNYKEVYQTSQEVCFYDEEDTIKVPDVNCKVWMNSLFIPLKISLKINTKRTVVDDD